LVDDDNTSLSFEVNTSLAQDSDSPLANAFAAAYIRPKQVEPAVNTNRPNFNRNIYCRVAGCDEFIEVIPVLLEGRNTAPPLSPEDYWFSYLQGAFQMDEKGDLDPDSEIDADWNPLGITAGGQRALFGAQTYLEQLRESPHGQACSPIAAPHELGHQFGIGHVDTHGIMTCCGCDGLGPYFAAESVRALRENGVRP
jgi:hypothetical protein